VACNGVMHLINTVLLPFDGDGKLDPKQRQRLVKADDAMDARDPQDGDTEYFEDLMKGGAFLGSYTRPLFSST